MKRESIDYYGFSQLKPSAIMKLEQWEAFYSDVQSLRKWQKHYFETKQKNSIIQAKHYEKRVDNVIKNRYQSSMDFS